MKRHAAFPYGEYLQRMGKIVARLVEQHLAHAPAQHHAEHTVEQQVVDVLPTHAMPGLRRRAPLAEPEEGDKAGQVHQAVPAHGKRADGDGDRVELGVDQHGNRTSE